MKFDITEFHLMTVLLGIGFILIAISVYRAHKDRSFEFNAFDLIMVDGRVDRVALAFMLVLAVTTWLMIDLQLKDKMTEGYITSYGAMWVIPLVSKVVFNRNEPQNVPPVHGAAPPPYQPLPEQTYQPPQEPPKGP